MVFHEITKEAIQRARRHHPRPRHPARRRPGDPPHPRPALRLRGQPGAVAQGQGRGCPPAACSRSRPAWSSTASASGWRSAPRATGTSRATSPRMPSRTCSRPSSPASTARKVATGRDFDDDGTLTNAKATPLDEAAATGIANALRAADVTVTDVSEKPYTRRPSAPFTTSTLQQEASRKLRLNSRNAMRVAQRLYENGYITYMRTDCTSLSESGADRRPHPGARDVRRRVRARRPAALREEVKNAQEAHEAIRPAGDRFRTPAQVAGELRGEDFALYDLIWKRTVSSQMADARGSTASVRLGATLDDGAPATHRRVLGSGTVITFRGFLAAYEEGRDERQAARRKDEADGGAPPAAARGRHRPAHRAHRGQRPRDLAAAALHRGHPGQGDGGARHRPALDLRLDDRHHPGPRLRLEPRLGAHPQLARVRGDPAAGGALLPARRLRLHRLDGGGPRRHRPRRPAAGGLAAPLLLRRRVELGRGAARPRRGPRRHRRPGDLDDRHRRGHRRAGRPLRPVRRGGRAGRHRPGHRRGDGCRGAG